MLNLHANRLREIPANLFNSIKNLRVVDLSGNRLNYMPDFSFRDDSLERISLAGNSFVRIPYRLFTPEVVASLRELDLSYNSIGDLHSPELMAQFKVVPRNE